MLRQCLVFNYGHDIEVGVRFSLLFCDFCCASGLLFLFTGFSLHAADLRDRKIVPRLGNCSLPVSESGWLHSVAPCLFAFSIEG